jgi:hypothetical protein
MTQTDVDAAGGPTATVWRALIRGERNNYQDGTLSKTDDAMRWEQGSCAAILAGHEPTLKRTSTPSRAVVGYGLDAEAEGLIVRMFVRGDQLRQAAPAMNADST